MTRLSRLSLAALLTSFLLTADTQADNWARFRGPNGTGIANGENMPTKWSDEENIRWKTEIPGIGHSSPIVWENRLFLQSSEPTGKERWLLCIDTETGKVLWKKVVAASKGKTNRLNSMASSTPATDGKQVYALFWDGSEIALHAYDFKGKLIWQRELGEFKSQHGPAHSPVVVDGLVYFVNDQDGASTFYAFNAENGQTVWEKPRKPFRASYSVPTLYEPEKGKPQLIVGSSAGLTGYEPKTGKEIWNYTWTHPGQVLRSVASPVVNQGVVYIGGGNGGGARHFLAVKLGGTGDITETALAWQASKTTPYVPSLLSKGDYIYILDDNRTRPKAACYEAKTGKQMWEQDLKSVTWASPVMIDGNIYIFADNGRVDIIKASPEYQHIATNEMGEDVYASPAVANGCLYVRGEKHLFCISKKK